MKKLTLTIKTRLMLIFFLFIISNTALAGTLTSRVDRNQLSTNETLNLSITYDKQVNGSELDLSALSTQFEILNVSPQSTNSISIINGKSTRQESTVWSIVLVPKKQGALLIPAFKINNDRSQAININVDNTQQSKPENRPLQVLVSSTKAAVYPNEQFIVEIELTAQANVRDLNGPQLIANNTEVIALGQSSFQRIDNGIAKQVVLLKYAVFAEQVGKIDIPIMTYTGVKGGRRGFFGNSGTQVIARSEQLTITVKPKPPSNNVAPWFPADNVTLSSRWSNDKTQLRVGEPITRSITISAQGQRASVIPPLSQSPKNNATHTNKYKTYKDQPQLDNQTSEGGISSTRIESAAIVATQSGQLHLPELVVPWWNIQEQRWEKAILAAEILTVAPAAGGATSNLPVSNTQIPINTANDNTPSQQDNTHWAWKVATLLLIMVSLAQLYIIVQLRKRPNNEVTTQHNDADNEKEAWRQLQSSLSNENPTQVRQAVLHWGQHAVKTDTQQDNLRITLDNLAKQTQNNDLKQLLEQLDRRLYHQHGTQAEAFSFNELSLLLQDFRKQLQQSQEQQHTSLKKSLKPLYK